MKKKIIYFYLFSASFFNLNCNTSSKVSIWYQFLKNNDKQLEDDFIESINDIILVK